MKKKPDILLYAWMLSICTLLYGAFDSWTEREFMKPYNLRMLAIVGAVVIVLSIVRVIRFMKAQGKAERKPQQSDN